MNRCFCRSEACASVSEGGLEPPTPQRVDLQERGSEHETPEHLSQSDAVQPRRITLNVDGVNTYQAAQSALFTTTQRSTTMRKTQP